ncbi:MarR family winged helix-turn-helix transcriptional regulator [Schleiferilactobacillus shenzhenensis]|uniref:HTH marR-type domain-containing protein n=1 Tax=Schleiferilactobacillus shenzhenensis LY-73 TaxID=1231336 RepID=U4TJZ6_9LACO|nr:MarR family transcriptional regulator [Schleiferilactobacillus shenzhenensis]ERL64514.1 hypothetical protein L248_0925 [Schleiferilactobacillus shenzhenensis LY-73]
MTPEIGRLLKIASNRLSWGLDQFARQHGMTGTQMSFLDYLHRQTQAGNTVLQRDIEEEFQIKRSTATQILKTMEGKRLITRQTAAADARQKEVRLTPVARDIVAQVRGYTVQSDQRLLAGYTQKESDLITDFLKHIAALNKEDHLERNK